MFAVRQAPKRFTDTLPAALCGGRPHCPRSPEHLVQHSVKGVSPVMIILLVIHEQGDRNPLGNRRSTGPVLPGSLTPWDFAYSVSHSRITKASGAPQTPHLMTLLLRHRSAPHPVLSGPYGQKSAPKFPKQEEFAPNSLQFS